jgi:hypothetical protein
VSQEQLVEAYLEGRIGRRTFIRRLVAAGVSLSAAVAYTHLLQPTTARAEHTPDHYESPTVLTTDATDLAGASAILTAQVDPNRFPTTVWFEYGETSAYGSRTPDQAISGDGLRSVGASVTGLDPGRTYHFRARATNNIGTADGDDRTFAIPDPVQPLVVLEAVDTALADVIKARSLRVLVRADEAVAVTLTATMKKPKRIASSRARPRIVVAEGALELGDRGSDVATLQLSRAGRRALKSVEKARLKVEATATDLAANPAAASLSMKLS